MLAASRMHQLQALVHTVHTGASHPPELERRRLRKALAHVSAQAPAAAVPVLPMLLPAPLLLHGVNLAEA